MLIFGNNLSSLLLATSSKVKIEIDDFEETVEILQKRPNKQKLKIHLFTGGTTINVPDNVLKKNRDCIEIMV